MAKKPIKTHSLFITVGELAVVVGQHPQTIRKQARGGSYRGAIGGGRKPYKFRKSAIEKQLGLEAGSLD